MFDVMERKIKQTRAARGAVSSLDVQLVLPEVTETAGYRSIGPDFNKGADLVAPVNAASLFSCSKYRFIERSPESLA